MFNFKVNGWHFVLIILSLILILPVVFMISNSFKTLQDSYHSMLQIFPQHGTFINYQTLSKQVHLIQLIWNTFFMASIVTIGKIVTGLLSAYAFKYFSFTGKKWLYLFFVSTIFVPFTVVMIPNYLVISKMNLLNTAFGVALPQLADATGIMLFLNAMNKIPSSLTEALRIDRVPSHKILTNIIIPVIRPSIISIGAIFFINSWNEYVWPTLILKDKSSFTLPLALQNYISSEGGTNFPLAMALSTIIIIVPLLIYLVFQRYILNSISNSGLK
ncbi:carbohydrate ABC transporter permease [Leuconostoc sp. MS02]|uniref:Carbohydrate ABC transporter permease n=1 Tax=Leuconostoc aquikimchii TaxID=3236804 RepID=A0ABV3S3G6_9LACO